MKETTSIRKGNIIHFLNSDRKEEIIGTYKANNPYEGEITTDKNGYSVAFIRRWMDYGFVKLYKS